MLSDFLNSQMYPQIPFEKYTKVTELLRSFFIRKNGFAEVHPQNRLAILAACENPHSIAKFSYDGLEWPLPQTGQMTLEDYLLTFPEQKGFCCVTTSYRNEKNPEPGRHHKIFPMFEFESAGNYEQMIALETELLQFLGFTEEYVISTYELMQKKYNVLEIDSATEGLISQNESPVFFLTLFPEHTNPFWNMKRAGATASKCDVILHGQETIGSAERSCDVEQMRETFFAIEGGKYSEKLFELFGYDRVIEELNQFLEHKFFPRYGGGIGLTRLVRAMEMSGLL
jgi:aspartyl/asparaginyl-tRNA synthetase